MSSQAEPQSTEIPKKLQILAVEIDEIKGKIEKTVEFARVVSDNPVLFCQQEIQAVQIHLTELAKQRDRKTKLLAEAVDLYRKKVLMIRSTLAKRKVLLENIDQNTQVLTDNKKLMETFAQGHALLQQEMTRAESEIGCT